MFVIWGFNQNADKEWIRRLVGKLHTVEFSVGWVLKIRRRHLQRTVQRLRNLSEWLRLKPGVYWEMCCCSGGHENWSDVCSGQNISYFPLHILPCTPAIFAIQSLCLQGEPTISPLPSQGFGHPFTWNGTISVSFYSLQNVLYTVPCFITSPHYKEVLEHHKRKKTEDLRNLRGYTLSECFSWMSWLLWSVEARGHFGLCTPELLEDQV